MKSFVVCVTVGEFSGQGEGKSKKIAKKLAAAAALAELRQLPHIPSLEKTLPRIKKKTKSIIKVTQHSVFWVGFPWVLTHAIASGCSTTDVHRSLGG